MRWRAKAAELCCAAAAAAAAAAVFRLVCASLRGKEIVLSFKVATLGCLCL